MITTNSYRNNFHSISFKNPLLYVLLALKISTVLSLNYINEEFYSTHWSHNTYLAYYSGDSHAYIKPIDNFIEEGQYYYQEGHGKMFAGRAPYYGSIYYVFRQITGHYAALDLLAFLQILIECFAGLVIATMVFRITKTTWTFWCTLALFVLSFYQTDYSGRILTESLANSALIFFAHYSFLLFTGKTNKNYFLAGFWLSVAVVLKPYFAPLYLLIFLFYDKTKKPSKNFLSAVLFSSTLILLITPFTYRNYIRFNIIQPFSSFDGGSGITEGDFAFRKYLQSIGESFAFWDPDCAGCLFTNVNVPCNYEFPFYVYTHKTDTFTLDRVKALYIEYLNIKTPEKEKQVIAAFDSLRDDYSQSRPFMYYAGSRILLFSKFIFQKGSYYIPNPFSGIKYHLVLALKIIQFTLYYFITLTGLAGIIYFVLRKKQLAYLFGIVPVFILLLFPVVLQAIEWRYWTAGHYFLIMSTVCFIFYISGKKKFLTTGFSKQAS